MATLRVPGLGHSPTKRRAIEDATDMQKSVVSSCQLSGQEIPQYHLSELIGKGNFGRVYKARSVASQQIVSIKIIDIEQGDATTQGYKILLAIC